MRFSIFQRKNILCKRYYMETKFIWIWQMYCNYFININLSRSGDVHVCVHGSSTQVTNIHVVTGDWWLSVGNSTQGSGHTNLSVGHRRTGTTGRWWSIVNRTGRHQALRYRQSEQKKKTIRDYPERPPILQCTWHKTTANTMQTVNFMLNQNISLLAKFRS